MIAALFVQTGGCYFGLPDVDPWDEPRDARLYAGPHPVVAHPPCQRWGRYWMGSPLAVARTGVRKKKGDDGGCFKAALAAEDAEATTIMAALSNAGLTLAKHTNFTAWKAGDLANVGGLRDAYRSKGERVLRDALLVLSHAYSGQVLRYAGTVFPGIVHIVANEHQGLSGEEIAMQEAEFMPGMIDLVQAASLAEWAKDIAKLSGETGCARRDAAKQIFEKAWGEFLEGYFEDEFGE